MDPLSRELLGRDHLKSSNRRSQNGLGVTLQLLARIVLDHNLLIQCEEEAQHPHGLRQYLHAGLYQRRRLGQNLTFPRQQVLKPVSGHQRLRVQERHNPRREIVLGQHANVGGVDGRALLLVEARRVRVHVGNVERGHHLFHGEDVLIRTD